MDEDAIKARALEYCREPAQAKFMAELSLVKGRSQVWDAWMSVFSAHCKHCQPQQIPDGIRAANLAIRRL